MTPKELIQVIQSKIMWNEINTDELRQIMDTCEVEIINRMAAAAAYMEE